MSECIPTEDRNNVFPQEKKNPSDSCGKEYSKAFEKMKVPTVKSKLTCSPL